MIWLYIAISVLGLILIALIAGSVFFFKFAIVGRHATIEQTLKRSESNPKYSPFYDRILEGGKWMRTHPHERVTISSYDNLKLCASIYEYEKETKNCMLLFHGWSSHPSFDFSCIVKKYVSLGTNVIIVDQRAHGESEGAYSCFGIKERYDVIAWTNYIKSRYGDDCKIILDGISMGASTVMMASGLKELPDNVVGIIADCGFTSAYDEFVHVMKLWYNLPPFPFIYIVNTMSKLIAGFGFKDVYTQNELKKSTLPLLIIHGGDDNFVPVKFSKINFEASASKNKKLIIVPGAAHGTSYLTDEKRCNEELERFIYDSFNSH